MAAKYYVKLVFLLFLSSAVSADLAHGFLPWISGGGQSSGQLVVDTGPPVYDYFSVCAGTGVIAYPAVNQTFYFPVITPNVTFTLSGTVNPTCYYSVGGAFNLFACANGNTSRLITLPEGQPLPLTLLVVQSGCANLTATTPLYVYYHPGYGADYRGWIILVVVGLSMWLLFSRRRRRTV